jgi:DNA modification methylase
MIFDTVLIGEAERTLREQVPDRTFDCAVTSPPYFGLRDYGNGEQIGREGDVGEYVERLVRVFREVRRTLRDDGTLWLNLGDSYNSGSSGGLGGSTLSGGQENQSRSNRNGRGLIDGLKQKDLIGVPWRVALALQADGWWLRSDCIWEKPNCLPESVRDRPTRSHEYVFMLAKSAKYYYDADAVREPWVNRPNDIKRAAEGHEGYAGKHKSGQAGVKGQPVGDPSKGRNKRTVWRIVTRPYKGAHFAVFPEALPEICIKAGSRVGGVVLDPFAGSGTTLAVAARLGRRYVGVELNPEYGPLISGRLGAATPAVDVDRMFPL